MAEPSFKAKAKHFVRRLLARLPFRRRTRAKPIWEGIFARFEDAKIGEVSYATPAHLDAVEAEAGTYLAQAKNGIPPTLWHEGLSLLAATVASTQDNVHIVDFGGGLGTGYLQLLSALPAGCEIRYDVVETCELVSRGRRLFANESRIEFHERMDALAAGPDIIYVNSALQYLDDYSAVLEQFADLRPRWIFMDRAAIGHIPSFVTLQMTVPGKVMRYWFLNQTEIVEVLAGRGYRLTHSGRVGPRYDQRNLPKTHRIFRMSQLLFHRADTSDGQDKAQ